MRKRDRPAATAIAVGAKVEICSTSIGELTDRQSGPAGRGPFAGSAEILWHAGLIPIPLTGEGDGKPPSVRGFTRWKRRPSIETLGRWSERWPGCNVGIVTGQKVTVVDIDDARLTENMIERFGPTPLQVTTPSGGRHLYYA